MTTLGGQKVSDLVLHVPDRGVWWASVELSTGTVPSPGPATLVVADLSLAGTVLPGRSGNDAPDKPVAIVAGGAGGWAPLDLGGVPLPSPPPSWQADSGVRLLTVLRPLARLSGETLATTAGAPTDTTLGPFVMLGAGSSGDALTALTLRGFLPAWWVDPQTGVTRFDARTGSVADAFCRVVKRNLRRGVRYVGLDTRAAAFLPGNTLEGAVISRTIYRESAGQLRAEVWS